MGSVILAMATFAFVGAVTPGPVNILATSTAVNAGVKEAAKHVLGASLAYAFVVYLSGNVMQGLLHVLPKLEAVMQVVGSLYLFYLAYKIFTAPVTRIAASHTARSGLWIGSLTQLLNPKAWLVAMSGISLFVFGRGDENLYLLIFTSVSLVLCLIGVGVWAVLGTVLASRLENPRQQRQFNRVMGVLLAVSVLMIWT
ncbi:transporter [Enterovibrio norvegicus FF-162]|uniref:Transporter n=1 Tax=Enterovibrio norvegicus FF-454 TaxID=1185651 RepID=A0A1E5C7X6_9GAMM|nr:LysE family translocator [Enterovibrio norvegicus]OEE61596.1 transporter [Enterovibrio norvegicus FF-454]OEE87901.1 transporter [Enterovibrio norvegicus FF-162]